MLKLFPSKLRNYYSDNWEVTGYVSHLPSITPTVIPNAGYGGMGWALRIFEKDGFDILVELYKNAQLIQKQVIKNGDECVVVPDGGKADDYEIQIHRVVKKESSRPLPGDPILQD